MDVLGLVRILTAPLQISNFAERAELGFSSSIKIRYSSSRSTLSTPRSCTVRLRSVRSKSAPKERRESEQALDVTELCGDLLLDQGVELLELAGEGEEEHLDFLVG